MPLALRRLLPALFAAACLLAGAGCAGPAPTASAPAASGSSPEVDASAAAAGRAVLYVLNASGPTLFASNQELNDNGQPLSSLPRQTWVKLSLAPGPHEFRFRQFPGGRRVARLQAQPGGVYYLVSAYNPAASWALPLGGDPLRIVLVDAAQAQALMAGMHEQAPAH